MRRLAPLFVAVVTLAVWSPSLTHQWVDTFDDAVFLLGNPHIRVWDWTWMATTQWYGHWMPLTWLSFVANYALFGFMPLSWHAVNVGLHAISAVLLYFIARRLLGSTPGAIAAALLWAVHPSRMESVAWITERKDVMMGVFFLGAALLWLKERRWWAFAAFVAACMSKSPSVILPAMLLTLEWWRDGGRLRLHVVRLAPFLAVSVIVSGMAFWSLHTILVSLPWSVVGLGPRLWHMAYSEVFYAAQTVWPNRLSGLIEYTWVPSWDQPQYPLSAAVCLLGALVCWRTRSRWPALTAAAIAYTVAVLPQSGIFQNGAQLVANRYSYLASLPLVLLAGGAVAMASRYRPGISLAGAGAVVGALAAVMLSNLPMWYDGDAMWQYAARHEPTCTQCLDMASAADVRHGDIEGALRKQRQAIVVSDTTMAPRFERHWNLAALLLLVGRKDEAIREIRTYIALVPPERRHNPVDREHIDRARATLASFGLK